MSFPAWVDAYRDFSWQPSLRALDWTETGDVNLGVTIVDRHAGARRVALRWYGKDGASREQTFDDLARASNQVAGFLRRRGVGKGDRVAGFLPRVPETLAVMLGAWKVGAVYVPIFTGFGGDAVQFRIEHSRAGVLFTHGEHRGRVRSPLPRDAAIVTIAGAGAGVEGGDIDFHDAMAKEADVFDAVPCRRDDTAVLLYTSGSTGPPKGVRIANNFVLAIHPYMTYAVGLEPGDVFWPTGDPGWGYGLVCYMVALAMGVPVVSHEATPAPDFCLARLRALGVTNFAATPTLLRGVMALGDAATGRDIRVRRASSCGEPLNAEVITFFRRMWGITIMDQYGASEFGLPLGNFNALAMEVKPGSMGLPLPGCRMAIVDDEGREAAVDAVGHIAMRPSDVGYYALGYWEDPVRTREMTRGGWVTIGDLGRRDVDGYFWFEGRVDDVIKSAGYRIGPFEVESAILHHPAVAEAAVIGKPDALRGHIVKAFVVLKPGTASHAGLTDEIVEVVRSRIGRHQYPREIEFVDQLPKTETGKIQRFVLRQR